MLYARLFSLFIMVTLASCQTQDSNQYRVINMSELLINGIRLSFIGRQVLPLSVILRDSPNYDGASNFFTVSLKNESSSIKALPFDELRRNTITKYKNTETAVEFVNNKVPPPRPHGLIEEFNPGETKSFQVVFEYPTSIVTMHNRVATLQFCVKWQSDWLRKSTYTAGSYDWNESFEICREIRIIDEVD